MCKLGLPSKRALIVVNLLPREENSSWETSNCPDGQIPRCHIITALTSSRQQMLASCFFKAMFLKQGSTEHR